jgi:16S rRNA (uracil1498-N3)-methyltransferase
MTSQKTNNRLFVEADLSAGLSLALDDGQAHYLGNVMRSRVGDGVVLFNGRDGEWSASIEELAKNRCSVKVGERLRPQTPESGPWLAFAPLKKTRTDFVVEKATELGASRLCPVITQRTNSARVNIKRLQAHAIEAAEQCDRLSVPRVNDKETLEQLITGWPKDRRLLFLDESGSGRPIVEVLSGLHDESAGIYLDLGFLIGPEGGFDTSELNALCKLDFVTAVDLGPRLLRAETAALAALACWQAFFGERR